MLLLQVLKILALLSVPKQQGSLWSRHWMWIPVYPIFPVLLRTNECLFTEKNNLIPVSIYVTNLATWVLHMWFLEGTEQQHYSKSAAADCILRRTDLSTGSSGAGLTGIVKSWCRQQWTVSSSYQAQHCIFLQAVNE